MGSCYKKERGQVFVFTAISLVVLLALIGLAIDVGIAYGVKTKLSSAVDSAGIAAGRVISQGVGPASRQAENFFNSNYPKDLLGATTSGPLVDAKHNSDGSWTITTSATATVPSNFAKVVGWKNFTVKASSTTTVRTLDLILVLDSSGSLNTPNTTPALLKSAAKDFIKKFDTTSDRIGLIHFASGAVLDVPITDAKGFNLTAINNAIDNIRVRGATTSEDALRRAKEQLDSITPTSRSSLRVIVFFTDGAPNGVAGRFTNGPSGPASLYSETSQEFCPSECEGITACRNPSTAEMMAVRMFAYDQQDNNLGNYCSITTLPETDYSGTINLESDSGTFIRPLTRTIGNKIVNSRCNVNKAARNMLENVANAARSEADPVHIFTIGLGASLTRQEIDFCNYGSDESGENILRRLANVEGSATYNVNQPIGLYAYAADASQLNNAFNKVASAILHITK